MRRLTRGAPALLLLAAFVIGGCSSDVVRLPDCGDCRPVEMTMSQTFEADLGWMIRPSQEAAVYDWVVADPGTMTVVDVRRGTRSEDPAEALDGISHYVITSLQPTEVGTTTLRFELRDETGALRQDLGPGQGAVAVITVVVTG